jgi:hypothetical protein
VPREKLAARRRARGHRAPGPPAIPSRPAILAGQCQTFRKS